MILKNAKSRQQARILLDTDIGSDVDDVLALLFCLKAQECIRLEAVTTVYGPVRTRAKVALTLMQEMRMANIPVAAGYARPLTAGNKPWQTGFESDGVDESLSTKIDLRSSTDILVSTIIPNSGQITIVAIGPLTNIACAIEQEPNIIKNVREIILMGGVFREKMNGYVLPQVENNIQCDPRAAEIVLHSGLPVTMVPLDVTLQTALVTEEIESLYESLDTSLRQRLMKWVENWLNFSAHFNDEQSQVFKGKVFLHDPLAVAVSFDRSLVRTEKACIGIDGSTGRLYKNHSQSQPEINICTGVDVQRFKRLFMSTCLRDL